MLQKRWDLLKRIEEKYGTQSKFATTSGLDKRVVSDLVRGRVNPTGDEDAILIEFLGDDALDLL